MVIKSNMVIFIGGAMNNFHKKYVGRSQVVGSWKARQHLIQKGSKHQQQKYPHQTQ